MERFGPHSLSWHDIVSVGSLIFPFVILVCLIAWNYRDEKKREKEEAQIRRDIPWTPKAIGGARRRQAPSHADLVGGLGQQ